jgi:flagellar biosynthesis/type III secretory pathway protein FliH
MSSLAQELDATLESLEPSTAATLASMVREAMQQVRGRNDRTRVAANLQSWEKRLASRSAQLATGKQGTPLQQVMDDLRS